MMSFEIGVIHKTQPHLLADLAELVLLTRYDDAEELSQARLEQLGKELPLSAEELPDNSIDGEEEEIHAIDQQESSDRAVEDCWAQLEYRRTVYEEYYPFDVDGVRLVWKKGKRTSKQCLYSFLLVCSRLRSFGIAGFPQNAAKAFTHISRIALEALVGPDAEVRIFDANSEDRRTYYSHNLRIAIKKLAQDLGAHNISESEIDSLSTSGDYGLDLVAIHGFKDGATGSFSIFGQCGAQETEWPSKTLEAHPLKFSGLFNCLHQPANLMFIPVSYRTASGAWVATHKTSGCLLIDRLRILQLLNTRWKQAEPAVQTHCYSILGKVV
jgi:hypothetical protein